MDEMLKDVDLWLEEDFEAAIMMCPEYPQIAHGLANWMSRNKHTIYGPCITPTEIGWSVNVTLKSTKEIISDNEVFDIAVCKAALEMFKAIKEDDKPWTP